MIDKEFKGNFRITISDHEVRVWLCNAEGQNEFRLKFMGDVHGQANDIIVVGKPALSQASKARVDMDYIY